MRRASLSRTSPRRRSRTETPPPTRWRQRSSPMTRMRTKRPSRWLPASPVSSCLSARSARARRPTLRPTAEKQDPWLRDVSSWCPHSMTDRPSKLGDFGLFVNVARCVHVQGCFRRFKQCAKKGNLGATRLARVLNGSASSGRPLSVEQPGLPVAGPQIFCAPGPSESVRARPRKCCPAGCTANSAGFCGSFRLG